MRPALRLELIQREQCNRLNYPNITIFTSTNQSSKFDREEGYRLHWFDDP